MSAKGLEVIDSTVQLTHEWINELKGRLDWTSDRDTLRLMRVTLTQIRDQLRHDEMAQLAAQLPLLIRGMFYEGWDHSRTPVSQRGADDFVSAIEKHVGGVMEYRGAEDIAAVFRLLDSRISEGEIEDVRNSLPEGIRKLWPR